METKRLTTREIILTFIVFVLAFVVTAESTVLLYRWKNPVTQQPIGMANPTPISTPTPKTTTIPEATTTATVDLSHVSEKDAPACPNQQGFLLYANDEFKFCYPLSLDMTRNDDGKANKRSVSFDGMQASLVVARNDSYGLAGNCITYTSTVLGGMESTRGTRQEEKTDHTCGDTTQFITTTKSSGNQSKSYFIAYTNKAGYTLKKADYDVIERTFAVIRE